MFLPQPILGKENWRTKDVLKFYGPSFHQQHDLAMHAKQWFTLLLFSMVYAAFFLRCFFLTLLLFSMVYTAIV